MQNTEVSEYITTPDEWADYDPTAEPIETVFRDIVHGEPPF